MKKKRKTCGADAHVRALSAVDEIQVSFLRWGLSWNPAHSGGEADSYAGEGARATYSAIKMARGKARAIGNRRISTRRTDPGFPTL